MADSHQSIEGVDKGDKGDGLTFRDVLRRFRQAGLALFQRDSPLGRMVDKIYA